jgi:hypothetical protein
MHAMGNDALIYLLTAKDYPKFAFINEILAYFRAHDDSITNSSDSIRLIVIYYIAMAYFVRNYIDDARIRKGFNSRFLYICLRNIFNRKYGLFYLKVFYFQSISAPIDTVDFLGFLIEKIISRLISRHG